MDQTQVAKEVLRKGWGNQALHPPRKEGIQKHHRGELLQQDFSDYLRFVVDRRGQSWEGAEGRQMDSQEQVVVEASQMDCQEWEEGGLRLMMVLQTDQMMVQQEVG